MKDEKKNNNILSASEIERIRKVYSNYSISNEYLNSEVKNIMKCEKINKETAIKKIIKILSYYC